MSASKQSVYMRIVIYVHTQTYFFFLCLFFQNMQLAYHRRHSMLYCKIIILLYMRSATLCKKICKRILSNSRSLCSTDIFLFIWNYIPRQWKVFGVVVPWKKTSQMGFEIRLKHENDSNLRSCWSRLHFGNRLFARTEIWIGISPAFEQYHSY